jgi:hypothetical protein
MTKKLERARMNGVFGGKRADVMMMRERTFLSFSDFSFPLVVSHGQSRIFQRCILAPLFSLRLSLPSSHLSFFFSIN